MNTTAAPPASPVRRYVLMGAPFQALLIGGIIYGSIGMHLAGKTDPHPRVAMLIGLTGMIIAGLCMASIYLKKPASKHLMTTGLFRYTRHPMYTGLAIMAVDIWWPTMQIYTVGYWISFSVFVVGLVVAGYIQEKETLARFGEEAEAYYRKTPRLFFLYPFTR